MITALALAICGFVCFKIVDFSALFASGGEKSFCESTNQKLFLRIMETVIMLVERA